METFEKLIISIVQSRKKPRSDCPGQVNESENRSLVVPLSSEIRININKVS